MNYSLRLLTQNSASLLLIFGTPLLTTNGLGAERQPNARVTNETSHDFQLFNQPAWNSEKLKRYDESQPLNHINEVASELRSITSADLEDVAAADVEKLSDPQELDWVKLENQLYQSTSVSNLNLDLEPESSSQSISQENIQTTAHSSNNEGFIAGEITIPVDLPNSIITIESPRSKPDEYAQKPQALTQNTNTLLAEGNTKLNDKKYAEAVTSFEQALRQAESNRDQVGIAQSLSGKTAAMLGQGQHLEAENIATEALNTLGKLGQKYPDIEVDILLRRGYAYLGQEKLSEVKTTVKQVIAVVPKLKASEGSAGLLVSLADLQYALGDKDAGNQSAQQAVSFLQRNPDPSGAIAVLSRLAVSQYASEKPEETVQTLDRITELTGKLKEQPKRINLLQAVGGLYLKLAEIEDLKLEKTDRGRQLFEKARRSFESAWFISSQDNKTLDNARILLGFGRAHLGLRRNEEAVERAQLALEITKELEKAAGVQEPKKKTRSFFEEVGCGAERLFTRSSRCDEEDTELALLNQEDTVLKRIKIDARNIIAAAQLDQERFADSDASLRESLKITREIDDKLSGVSRTLRFVQGAAGILSLAPLGFVSEIGSYINTTAQGLDQMIALPQGGFSLLDRINTNIVSNSKKRSLEDLKQQQESARSRGDALAEAETLLQLGAGYLGIGRYGDAGQVFKDASALFKQLNQPVKQAQALLGSGRSLYLERNYEKAQKVSQQAFDISQQEGDSLGAANSLLTLGTIHLSQSKLAQAHEKLQEAYKLFSSENDDKDAQIGKANTLLALGTVALRQRKYKLALQQTEEAIGIFQVTRNGLESSRARLVRGSAYQSLGNHKLALEEAQKALFVFKSLGDRAGEISALNNIGDVLQSQKRYEQAIKFYGLSAELQKDLQKNIQKPRPKTGVLIDIVRVGSFFLPLVGTGGQAGIKIYNALSIAQSVVYLSETATSSLGSGASYLSLGDYEQAIDAFDQVRKASQNKDPQKEAEALLGLSNTRLSFDRNPDMAKQDAEQATRLFNEIGDRAGAAYGLLAQGISYNRLGKSQADPKKRSEFFDDAFVAIQKAISAFQDPEILDLSGTVQTYSALADLLVDKGQDKAAVVFYKKSIEASEQIRRNIPEGELRTTYVGKLVETYRRLIDLLLSQARVPEAQQILELLKAQEIQEYTGITRASIGDDNKIVYADGIEKEVAQKYDGKIIALGLQLAECKQNCQALERQRDELTSQFDKLVEPINQEISKRPIGQDPLIYNPNSLNSEAQKIVEPCKAFEKKCPKPVNELSTMLIYPFIAEDEKDKTKYKLWLLWASRGGASLAISRNVDRKVLEETVFKFYDLVSRRGNLVELQQKSKQLYGWLVQPLEEQLKAGKINNLVFVLDRFLRYVPMAALFDGNEYLIQKGYQVSTIISAKATNMTDRLSFDTKNLGILAMGLSKQKQDFIALEDVPKELEGIVRRVNLEGKTEVSDKDGIYPGRIYLNEKFDLKALTEGLGKESLRKYNYKILHIATHGKFIPGSDRSSFLVLGEGDEKTLKKLTIPDIDKNLQQRLTDIHLVVLSACQTALGGNTKSVNDELDGLEIPGLSYSFIREGRAKAVLASLWLVNSQTTAKLMQAFYRNLADSKKPITKAEALRRAQLFILTGKNQYEDKDRGFKLELAPGTVAPIADSSHPFYWAPFTLIGNGL